MSIHLSIYVCMSLSLYTYICIHHTPIASCCYQLLLPAAIVTSCCCGSRIADKVCLNTVFFRKPAIVNFSGERCSEREAGTFAPSVWQGGAVRTAHRSATLLPGCLAVWPTGCPPASSPGPFGDTFVLPMSNMLQIMIIDHASFSLLETITLSSEDLESGSRNTYAIL